MLESEVDMNDHDEETLASLQQANDQLMAKNHALVKALSRATQEMTKTKAQLNQLAGPPMTFATMVRVHSAKTDEQGVQHASAEVAAGARRMIVPIAANLQASRLEPGRTVLLNENMVVVSQLDTDTLGAVRSVRQVCDDGRLLVADGGGNVTLVRCSGTLAKQAISAGDRVNVDASLRFALSLVPPRKRRRFGSGRSAGRHLRRHRRTGRADRTYPRRRADAVPASRTVRTLRPETAERRAAVRSSRNGQDPARARRRR